uniref:ATPase subunit 8 n=1 Tax=Appolonius crassus TaxID=2813428 RepID=A0A8T9ZWA6_9HEMI|nr:ATPase subunit 8 [Appolonius crassus]
MPQMSPMWWEILFFMFLMTYIMVNTIMYWNKNNEMKNMKYNSTTNNMNWKW